VPAVINTDFPRRYMPRCCIWKFSTDLPPPISISHLPFHYIARARPCLIVALSIKKKKKKRTDRHPRNSSRSTCNARARALGSRLAGLEGRGREGLGRAWKLRYSPHAEDEGESYVITTPALRHVETPQRFVPRFSANTRLS